MDSREQNAWRAWRAEPVPENAQQWAVCHARGMDRPEGSTPLLEHNSEESLFNDRLRDALERATRLYLTTELEESFIEDLHWLTESHFWLLDPAPSPRTMQSLRSFFKDNGMELQVGDEDAAERDHEVSLERSRLVESWRKRCRRHQLDAESEKSRANKLAAEVRKLKLEIQYSQEHDEIKALKTQVSNLEHMLRAKTEETDRLAKALQGKK